MQLREIATVIDCEHKTAPTEEFGIPSIRTPNIGRGRLILEGVKRVNQETYEKWTRRGIPKPGDLILAREAPVGNVALILNGQQVCLGQRTVLIQPDHNQIYSPYLTYLMLGDEIQGRFHSVTNGAIVPHLNLSDIRKLELPELPTLVVQRKIAGVLGAYDDLIENNRRRIAILEEMARLIYREWFVQFRFPGHEAIPLVESELGPIPQGWEVKELTDIGFVGRGKSRHRPRNDPTLYGGRYPFFQTGNIKNSNTYLWTYTQTYSDLGLAQSKIWDSGTLCITIAANIAETAILARKGCFPDSVVGFVANSEKIDAIYIKMFIESIKEKMQNASRGTTQDNLSVGKLLKFMVPVPPFFQLQEFRDKVNPLLDASLVLFKVNEQLQQTRDLLLPRLISGEVDVSELEIPTGETEEPEAAKPAVISAGGFGRDDASVVCALVYELERAKISTREFMVQKYAFALKHYCGLPVHAKFDAWHHGPWSPKLKDNSIYFGKQHKWLIFDKGKKRFSTDRGLNGGLAYAEEMLGDQYQKIQALVQQFKEFKGNKLEQWMTVYKVVIDQQDAEQNITRDSIQQGIDEWKGKREKAIFSVEHVDNTIGEMVHHGWFSLHEQGV